jgi:tetratricopeptide (TPR) repeat protein
MISRLDGGQRVADLASDCENDMRTLYALATVEMLELRDEPCASRAPDRKRKAAPKRKATPAPTPVPAPAKRAPEGAGDARLRSELTKMAREMRVQSYYQSYYEILGVPTTSDDEAIGAAYDALLARVHPDLYQSESGAIRQVADEIHRLASRAHDALKNASGRAAYASQLKESAQREREAARGKKALAAETAFQQGEAALRQRDYQGALLLFGRAMEQLSEEGEYHAHYGWCLHLCHPDNSVIMQEAIEHVKRGIKLARDREKPYLYLGRLYKAMGKPGAAEKMFTRSVQIRPDCVEALRELRLLNMRRDKQKGIIGRLLRR